MRVYTVGHSTRPPGVLEELLRAFGVLCLLDVRRYPWSRRHPHFAQATLREALARAGIEYVHAEDLGGRRPPRADSPNTAWRDPGLRGYADYMATPAFAQALSRLTTLAARAPTAILCAEALPERCHRQLIADALSLGGVEIVHILGPTETRSHEPNRHARRGSDGTLVYAQQGVLPGTAPARPRRTGGVS